MSDLRIQSGLLKGMQLHLSAESPTRPTAVRARMAMVNSLATRLQGASVLDLFAGSGAFGLECVSRGASRSVFVEKDRKVSSSLQLSFTEARRRFQKQKISEPAMILHSGDVEPALKGLGSEAHFDIIFADPPYDLAQGCLENILISCGELTKPGAIFIFEVPEAFDLSKVGEHVTWRFQRDRKYGIARFLEWERVA